MMFFHFLLPRNWSNPLLPSSRASARLVTWWSLLACNQQLRFVGLQLVQPTHIQPGYIYIHYVLCKVCTIYLIIYLMLYNVQKVHAEKEHFRVSSLRVDFYKHAKDWCWMRSHAHLFHIVNLHHASNRPVETICNQLTTHYHRKSFWYPKANSIQTPVFSYSCFPPGPRIATWHVPRRTGRTCPETWAFFRAKSNRGRFLCTKKPSRLVI